jgi:hypothetical protein
MALLDNYEPQGFADRGGLLGRLLSLRPDLAEDGEGVNQPASMPQAPGLAPSLWPTATASPNSISNVHPVQYAQAPPIRLWSPDPLYVHPEDTPTAQRPLMGSNPPLSGPLVTGGGGLLGLGLGAMILNNAKKTEEAGDQEEPGDKPASTPIGRRGEPIGVKPGTNRPATIDGRVYTGHAGDQMQGRRVPPSAVEDAIQNGAVRPGNNSGETVHVGINGVIVVTGSDGQVITVITGKP